MRDTWMGSLAAQDEYRPADDPWGDDERRRASEPYRGVSVDPGLRRAPGDMLPKPPVQMAEHIVGTIGRGLVDTLKTPGAMMQPNPYERGTEDWQWYENQRLRTMQDYGPSMALNLYGAASPFAKPGTIGAAGGKLTTPQQAIPERLDTPVTNERAVIGGNAPPEPIGSLAATDNIYNYGRSKPAKRSTEIPNIRDLPVADAIEIARTQPHLIKAGNQSEGYYVGGPRDMMSKAALNAQRKWFDQYVAADPRGGDWYDRYRNFSDEVTGGDPNQQLWMSNQHGQWSAGVDPGSETHFALKENNATIAGMPVKAARPAQHEAHMRAIEMRDPEQYQLGDKTGEYAELTRPSAAALQGATGVNDFRHARNWGYTEASGVGQKNALTDAQHRFLDMETALAVDRANKMKLDGRSDWTGEQLQAAPWVRQKALDIQERGGKNEDGTFKISYEEAFQRANKTIADYAPRHTYTATFEQQPGADVKGHMMGSVLAPQAARDAYFADPRSNWATAPKGRDAVYSGLGIPGTGVNMRVRPSVDMQGYYVRPDGTLEMNPGQAARPLGTFDTPRVYDKNFVGPREFEAFKSSTPADQSIMNAGEAFRAWLDAQNAGAWHKGWVGGPVKEMNSLFIPRSGKASVSELQEIQRVAGKHGLGDVADTGQGVTVTSFYPTLEGRNPGLDKALKAGDFDKFGEPQRIRIGDTDKGFIDYAGEGRWSTPGSDQATLKMLEYVNKTPQLREAFNQNPYLAERALARLERDEAWAKAWGAPRKDIQLARRVVADGPGWVDRIEKLIGKGLLPATAAALFAGSMQGQDDAGL